MVLPGSKQNDMANPFEAAIIFPFSNSLSVDRRLLCFQRNRRQVGGINFPNKAKEMRYCKSLCGHN